MDREEEYNYINLKDVERKSNINKLNDEYNGGLKPQISNVFIVINGEKIKNKSPKIIKNKSEKYLKNKR